MKILFLYGPAAVGKYTIGKILAEKTGYRFFHNHLTRDAVTAVFEKESKSRSLLIQEFRKRIFEEAAKSNEVEGIIFTFLYAHPIDWPYVEDILSGAVAKGADVNYIHFLATKEDLEKRVALPHRQNSEKISEWSTLKWLMEEYDLESPMEEVESISVNTSKMTEEAAANYILECIG